MTALHWAAHHDDLEHRRNAGQRRRRRQGGEPLRRDAALARLHEWQWRDRRTAARCRGRSEHDAARRRDGLMTAARTGKLEPVQALLVARRRRQRQGAKRADGPDVGGGRRPRRGRRALLKAGADFRTPLASGFTPLFFAVREGRIDVVRPAGSGRRRQRNDAARRNRRQKAHEEGTSPLILAVENGHFELAVVLLEAGADPNDQRIGLHGAARDHLGPQAEPRRRRRRRPRRRSAPAS